MPPYVTAVHGLDPNSVPNLYETGVRRMVSDRVKSEHRNVKNVVCLPPWYGGAVNIRMGFILDEDDERARWSDQLRYRGLLKDPDEEEKDDSENKGKKGA